HVVVFSYRYADLRDLHSFPTRRSSDLGPWSWPSWSSISAGLPPSRRSGAWQARCGPARAASEPNCPPLARAALRRRRPRQGTRRSEEHTSELQSQSNLVCRLLLEKKKK